MSDTLESSKSLINSAQASSGKKPETTLDCLLTGQKGVVSSVCSQNPCLCKKLLDMGIVSGATIEKICVAPLGDPVQFKALGYKLSLRQSEARSIRIVPEI